MDNSKSEMQVQVVDQSTHPSKCHSFVGLDRQIGSSPPAEEENEEAEETIQKEPCDSKAKVTHTHIDAPHTPTKGAAEHRHR